MTTSFDMQGRTCAAYATTLNQVGESSLHLSELANSEPQQKHHHCSADADSAPLDAAVQNTPAKRIDDSDQRVQRVQQAPLLWHDARTESDRRNIESKLNQKRNHVA